MTTTDFYSTFAKEGRPRRQRRPRQRAGRSRAMCAMTYAHCLRALSPHPTSRTRRRPADLPATT
ncbi:hypothetical protein [Streptomyces avermitilis]|uniref:hypothetical protein n=1 Tax=Streptomyces avermitilis TaxID=33903 RepID=UPI0021B6EC25|nr:hypothetical protein [Streptomyces avermitilis]